MDTASKLALSLRGIERAYGIDRHRLQAAIASGELPAARLGVRRLHILRADVEAWLRKHAIRPTSNDEAFVDRALEREEARRAS